MVYIGITQGLAEALEGRLVGESEHGCLQHRNHRRISVRVDLCGNGAIAGMPVSIAHVVFLGVGDGCTVTADWNQNMTCCLDHAGIAIVGQLILYLINLTVDDANRGATVCMKKFDKE